MQRRGIKKVQLGSAFPGVFLGIPVDIEVNTVKEWFSNSGWDVQFPRRVTNMIIQDLPNWSAPEGLLQSIQRANISFDLIHGLDNGDGVLSHVRTHANAEILELYRYALSDTKSCGIVRAKDATGSLLGTIIISKQHGSLATHVPALLSHTEDISGILAPIVPAMPQSTLVLQGLALMGVRQSKGHKAAKVVLGWVSLIYLYLWKRC